MVFFETGSLARFRITYNMQGGLVVQEKMILVSCPKCGIKINNTSSWFKKPGSCCPGCQLRVGTERFKKAVEEAEKLA